MQGKIKINQLFVDVVFPFYLLLNMFTMTTFCYVPQYGQPPMFAVIVKLLRYMIYIISLINVVITHYKHKEIRLALLIFGTFAISLLFNRDTEYFCYILVFLALLDAPRRKIISKHFWITFIFSLALIIITQIGIVEDVVTYGTRQRHFLGFNWVTYPAILLLFLLLDRAFLNKGKIKVYEAFLFLFAGYWLYSKTDSRFAFASLIASTIFFLVTKTGKPIHEKKKKKFCVLCAIPFMCFLFSMVVARIYNPASSIMFQANTLLSQRLRLMHEAIQIYPIRPIGGQVIKWQGFNKDSTGFVGYNYVDNSYIQLLLQYGLFLLLMVLAFYAIGIYRGIRDDKRYVSWILVIICIYCLLDPFLIRFTFNPFAWLGVEIVKPISVCSRDNAIMKKMWNGGSINNEENL